VTEPRIYTTRRQGILDALCRELKNIDGSGEFHTNLFGNVHPTLKFWDEIEEYPAVHLNAGSEQREYQGGGYKDRFLLVTVRVFVEQEEAWRQLDAILEDIETVLEENSRLQYQDRRGNLCHTQQITILSIDTDEGVLEPQGVGELSLEVRY
jgi:hypothetical protein